MKYSKVPRKVLLAITNQCNLHCDYCFVDQQAPEMSLDILKNLLQEMATFKVYRVVVSGGEPLLKPERLQIFKQYSFPQLTLRTNGTLLTSTTLEIIKEIDFYNIVVSLDGDRAQVHNKHRSHFKETLRSIKILLENKIQIDIGIVVTTDNLDYISRMTDFFYRLGVNSINYQLMTPYNPKNDHLVLNKNQQKQLKNNYRKSKEIQ